MQKNEGQKVTPPDGNEVADIPTSLREKNV